MFMVNGKYKQIIYTAVGIKNNKKIYSSRTKTKFIYISKVMKRA